MLSASSLKLLLIIPALIGVFFLYYLLTIPRPLETTQADFVQDYLIARAILEGENPYQPLSALGSRFKISALTGSPSAHPPTLAIAITPLGLLSYRTASLVWLIFSLICVASAVYLLFRPSVFMLVCLSLAFVAWKPVHSDLAVGQTMSLILVLLTCAWLRLRSGKNISAGTLIGLSLCVKLIAWPIVIYFILKKQWHAVASTIATFIGFNLIATYVLGVQVVKDYYLYVGPLVSKIYRSDSFNFSIWSIGPRIFTGTKGIFLKAISTGPLVSAPQLATATSLILVIAVLVLVLYRSTQMKFDRAFALLICASIVLSPTSWWFYLVLALLPLRVRAQNVLACGLLLLSPYVPPIVVSVFGDSLSFAVGLLMLTPLFALGLLNIPSDRDFAGVPTVEPNAETSDSVLLCP